MGWSSTIHPGAKLSLRQSSRGQEGFLTWFLNAQLWFSDQLIERKREKEQYSRWKDSTFTVWVLFCKATRNLDFVKLNDTIPTDVDGVRIWFLSVWDLLAWSFSSVFDPSKPVDWKLKPDCSKIPHFCEQWVNQVNIKVKQYQFI